MERVERGFQSLEFGEFKFPLVNVKLFLTNGLDPNKNKLNSMLMGHLMAV